jgi:xanthine/uracil/vitamin C permease (AzgA family)
MAVRHGEPVVADFREKSTPELLRAITTDSTELIRKEMELGKQELVEAVVARIESLAALAAIGLLGLMALVFGALAAASALDSVVAGWLARLIVAAGFLVLAGPAVLVAWRKAKTPPLAPTETARTLKEDVEWARAQLKR